MLRLTDEHSRVRLPEVDNDSLSTYINANYIRVSTEHERSRRRDVSHFVANSMVYLGYKYTYRRLPDV